MATVVGPLAAETLSDDEARSIGIDPMMLNIDPDNSAVQGLNDDIPQTDRQGRPVISFSQYLHLQSVNVRLDNYVLRVFHPKVPGKTYLIQASKWLKWYGRGWRSISERPQSRAVRQLERSEDEVTIYRCSDKYPDCKRFFDTQKSLEAHWRTEHGEMSKARARAAAAVTDTQESTSEE